MKNLYLIFLVSAIIIGSRATSQTWNGSAGSDWNTAANWTPATVPGGGSNVTINNAALSNQPALSGDVSIASISMSQGILNLNGFTITCTGAASFSGDSLLNGKVVAGSFSQVANMHMGGKIIFDKTAAVNNFWGGNNKVYTDSFIVIWRSGTLHLESSAPDSIFTHFKVQAANSSTVSFSESFLLYVQNDLVIDNTGNGTFSWNSAVSNVIGGNLVAINFSGTTTNLLLKNITTLGVNANGPFFCNTGSITGCNFSGNFNLYGDSSQTYSVTNSSFLGADNLIQSGSLNIQNCLFGQTGTGSTILRGAHNLASGVFMRDGSNKFYGDVQYDTYAAIPGGITLQQNYFGQDTCLGNMSFIMKGNSALTTNGSGNNYVAGNVIIDGQGARKAVTFTGGSGSFIVGGNFTVNNFTPYPIAGGGNTNLYLRNVYASGTDPCGTFYCTTGDIQNSSFNGNMRVIGDSSYVFVLNNVILGGDDNMIQAGNLEIQNSRFGKTVTGTTVLRAAHNLASGVLVREGNNKFFGNVEYETFAVLPGGATLQQNYFGQDTCLGNMSFIMKGNSALTTNGSGNNYVAGNVIIDGQGARKAVTFTGGSGTFTVGGNFTAKNFTPYPIAGGGNTNVYLRNVYASGTDSCGTFYCTTGDIQNSSFNGNMRVIGDSSNLFVVNSVILGGDDNLVQAGNFEILNSRFGKTVTGTTILRAAHNITSGVLVREGNNKFFGNVEYETSAVLPGGATLQQTFDGQDTCLGNMSFILKGNSALVSNISGNSYVAGNVIIDGQGARKSLTFNPMVGTSLTIAGNFTVKNFTPNGIPGAGTTNVFLGNIYASGTDTCGTFYCYTGDIRNSIFNGNIKVIGDSSQVFNLSNASLLGSDNILQSGNLDIQNSRFGQAVAGTTILRAAHNIASGVFMRDGNNKFLGDLQWEGYTGTGSLLIQQTFYGPDSCFGNFTMNLNGATTANLAGNNIYLAKGMSLINNGTGAIVHNTGASAIRFIGIDTADYSYSGSGSAPSILNIEMNRRGGLRLQSPLTYTGTLLFTRGIILSSDLNPLNIPSGAVVGAAWDSGYVDGPVNKTGNTVFTFPLGKNNVFAPLSITAPSLVTDAFNARYFHIPPQSAGYDTTMHDISLNHISRSEYWLLNRTNGTSAVKVELSWNSARSGVVDLLADLRVARWNGTTWKDEGIGGTTGTNDAGTIQTLGVISSFSPFTLASVSLNNAFPVNFTTFTAILRPDRTVQLQWKTSIEIKNAYFQVQKSTDGMTWVNLSIVQPLQSQVYEYIDKSLENGVRYYRIRQVDIDGGFTYTGIRVVRVSDYQLQVWPNPATSVLVVQLLKPVGRLQITDMNGKIVYSSVIDNTLMMIPVQQLRTGQYILMIMQNGNVYTKPFIRE